MEIYQLRAFVTAGKLGNLTRTAEALHLTQPAITAQIKSLEEELGVALFDRKPGRISLTRSGEALLSDAEAVLTAAQQLVGHAQTLKGQVTGQFILGTVTEPDGLRLGPLLSGFVQAMPLLEVRTRSGLAQELLAQVAAGVLHAAFFIGAHVPPDVQGLTLQRLHYRVVGPVAWRDQVLHADWRALAAMPWITAPAAHHVHHLMHEAFARRGLTPHAAIECEEYGLATGLVRSGVGLAVVREDMALLASERQELLVWPHARLQAQLSLIFPNVREHDPANVAMLSILRKIWGLEAVSALSA